LDLLDQKGVQGDTGFTGSTGDQGIIGFTGSKGAQGDTGLIGFTGSQGPVAGNNSELIYNNNGIAEGTDNIFYDNSSGFLGIGKSPSSELDIDGFVIANGFVGSLYGNSTTASSLENLVNIYVSGDGFTGSVAFDGSSDITIPLIPEIRVFTKSLTMGTDWQDVGINGDMLNSGSYMVQLFANDIAVGGFNNNEYYTGILSWTSEQTQNSPELFADEIVLHRAGQSNKSSLFLRTYRSNGLNKLKLQIFSNYTTSGASNYILKFRKFV
jgi:hypothetical protein